MLYLITLVELFVDGLLGIFHRIVPCCRYLDLVFLVKSGATCLTHIYVPDNEQVHRGPMQSKGVEIQSGKLRCLWTKSQSGTYRIRFI